MSSKQTLFSVLLIFSPILLLANDYFVATSDLNVRSGIGSKYPVLLTLKKGDQVLVLSKHGTWYKVGYSNKIGYASSKYLEPATAVKDNKQSKPADQPSGIFQNIKEVFFIILLISAFIGIWLLKQWRFNVRRKQRRNYYRNVYLQSEEWQRKRYVVLRRDNWQCVYCGARATQVHHKRYAKYNIGNEPIDWLVSVCEPCHNRIHH